MDAIVMAGGIPQPDDPLYTFSNGGAKALIDIAGKPMAQWVLDALDGARNVDNIILIGLSPKSGLTSRKPLHYISNQGRMLANIVAGVNKSLELDPKTDYVLIVSSDIPAIKPGMIDWLVETAMQTKDDLYYGICAREVMETRFPSSNRTYTRLKDLDLCGADINIAHVRMATEHLDLWESLIGNRKSPLRQAATVGFDTLFQILTRSITLEQLVEKVCRRIGIKGRAIVWENAEACMDVDKPHQLEIMRADLARQERKAMAAAKRAAPKKSGKARPAASARAKKTVKPKASMRKPASLKLKKAKAKAR